MALEEEAEVAVSLRDHSSRYLAISPSTCWRWRLVISAVILERSRPRRTPALCPPRCVAAERWSL